MKHLGYFSKFMKETVNLNQTRITILEGRVVTVREYLKNSDLLKDHFISADPQGSWEHKTIIKPKQGEEFDADLLVFLEEVPDWEPKDYINKIWKLFRDNDTYKEMVHRKSRCVYLDYAGDFHLDIIPCLAKSNGKFVVMNRNTNEEEPTDGEGYANWFRDKNSATGGNHLINVIRLTKYLRDHKTTFSAKSILLTTLLANQVGGSESVEDFKDLPTALVTLYGRLNTYLQANLVEPNVCNPVLPLEEDFNRHWDQQKYENFREKFNYYTEKINAAFLEEGQQESIKKWREIFGDDFGELNENRSSVTPTTVIENAPPRAFLSLT